MSTTRTNNNAKLKLNLKLKGVSFVSPLSLQNNKHSSYRQHRHNTSNSESSYHLRSSRTNIITCAKKKINLHNVTFVLQSPRNASHHKKVMLIGRELNLNSLFNDNNSRNNKCGKYYERKSRSNVNILNRSCQSCNKERSQSTNNRNKGKKKRIKRIDNVNDDENKCYYNYTWVKDNNNKRTSTKESTTSLQTNGNDDYCMYKGVNTPEELHFLYVRLLQSGRNIEKQF